MKPSFMRPYAALLVLTALLAGCTSSTGPYSASNNNAPQRQANGNSAEPPRVAQNNASPSTPPAVQTIPAPDSRAGGNPSPADKPPANRNANAAASARSPKLIVPEKKVDFGKQAQDKTLFRVIPIKNGGRADLNIEAIVPS